MAGIQAIMTAAVERGLRVAAEDVCKAYTEELSSHGLLTCKASEALKILDTMEITSKRSVAMKKVRASQKNTSSSSSSSSSSVRQKPSMLLPFCGVIEESWCHAVRFNHGLHTQCANGPMSDGIYCKTCQKSADNSASSKPTYGDIDDRLAVSALEYRDPKGKLTTCYANVAEKMGLGLEQAQKVATEFGWTIPPEQLSVVATKRGRPTKKGDEKNSAKKSSKVAKENNMEDQIATLVAEASAEIFAESVSETEEDRAASVVSETEEDHAASVVSETKEESPGPVIVKVAKKSSVKLAKKQAVSELQEQKEAAKLAKKQAASELQEQKEAAKLAKKQAALELREQKEAAKLAKKQAALELREQKEAAKLAKKQAALELREQKEAAKLAKKQAAKKVSEVESSDDEGAVKTMKTIGEEKMDADVKYHQDRETALLKDLCLNSSSDEEEEEIKSKPKEQEKEEEMAVARDGEDELEEEEDELEEEEDELELGEEMKVTIDEKDYFKAAAFGLPAVLFTYPGGDAVGALDEATGEIQELDFSED